MRKSALRMTKYVLVKKLREAYRALTYRGELLVQERVVTSAYPDRKNYNTN